MGEANGKLHRLNTTPHTGTGKLAYECKDGEMAHSNNVKSVAWHPVGTHLASGSADHCVKVWQAGTVLLQWSVSLRAECRHSNAL